MSTSAPTIHLRASETLSRSALRRELEAIAERAIELLDMLDGDPDLEPFLEWSRTMATTRFDRIPRLTDLEEA